MGLPRCRLPGTAENVQNTPRARAPRQGRRPAHGGGLRRKGTVFRSRESEAAPAGQPCRNATVSLDRCAWRDQLRQVDGVEVRVRHGGYR